MSLTRTGVWFSPGESNPQPLLGRLMINQLLKPTGWRFNSMSFVEQVEGSAILLELSNKNIIIIVSFSIFFPQIVR